MKIISEATLKALIQQRGLSYGDVGEMCGCHRSMISQLANGDRTSCKPTLAENIARCLNVPLELLFVPRASATSGQSISGERIAS
jgi:transcriptional regulator with XRE-family HTH domain